MQTFKLEDLNCYEIELYEDESEDTYTFEIWAEMYTTDFADHMFHIGDACVVQIPKHLVKDIKEV